MPPTAPHLPAPTWQTPTHPSKPQPNTLPMHIPPPLHIACPSDMPILQLGLPTGANCCSLSPIQLHHILLRPGSLHPRVSRAVGQAFRCAVMNDHSQRNSSWASPNSLRHQEAKGLGADTTHERKTGDTGAAPLHVSLTCITEILESQLHPPES